MSGRRGVLRQFHLWSISNRNNRLFFLACSIIIGIVAGLLSLFLKTTVFYLRGFVLSENTENLRFLLFVLPAIGIFLTFALKKWVLRDKVRHNVHSILHAISRRNSLMRTHKIFSSVVGAVFTAGFGGSVGLESPVISSGAAFGSNSGKWLRMNYKEVTVLLACGSSAAISAIFNTPIAGVIFAIEVLMIDMTRFSLIPLLLASVTGTIVTHLTYGEGILFEYDIIHTFDGKDISYYILFSVIIALVSLYFTKTFLGIERLFNRIKKPLMKIAIGGSVFGVLLYLFPQLYGEGYQNITTLLNGDMDAFIGDAVLNYNFDESFLLFFIFMLGLILLKVVATSITISAGGIGGIFAPSAVTGAMTGFLFAFSVNSISGDYILSPGNFALVGMAACLSGVLHAPLTGLFLIAEITSGYELIVPLLIAVTLVFVIVKIFEPNSIFTIHLARKGELITHHKDKAVLNFLKLEKLIEMNLTKVPVDANLGDLVKLISKSKRNIFPVLNSDGEYKGMIHVEDIRNIMFQQDLYDDVFVKDIMRTNEEVIGSNDTMQNVMSKFNSSGSWNLPVVEKGKYIGVISKSTLFSAYRKQLINITED
jgi:CIC family chloride channel protein